MDFNIEVYRDVKRTNALPRDADFTTTGDHRQLAPLDPDRSYLGTHVRALSARYRYDQYTAWCSDLDELATTSGVPGQINPLPFVELTMFTDTEGVIGSRVAKKLARDFDDQNERAEEFAVVVGSRFYDRYKLWHKAFDEAQHDGAVVFLKYGAY
jgi:hypothetical protein